MKKDYGKSLKWPACQKSMRKTDELIKKIYARWKAYIVLKPYPANLRFSIYLLALACEIIKKRPISSDSVHKWKGDYLADMNENPKSNVYSQSIAQLKQAERFHRILFSSLIHKVIIFFFSNCKYNLFGYK